MSVMSIGHNIILFYTGDRWYKDKKLLDCKISHISQNRDTVVSFIE